MKIQRVSGSDLTQAFTHKPRFQDYFCLPQSPILVKVRSILFAGSLVKLVAFD